MNRLMNALDRISTSRNLAIGITSSIVVVSIMGILTQSLVYDIYGDANMPDTNFGYTYVQIQEAFDILGSDGLHLWLQIHLLDLIFPLAYAFSMVFGILMELRVAMPERKCLRLLALFPLGGALADYLENTLIASQAVSYPILSEPVIVVASFVTILKWILISAGFVVILFLLMLIILKKARK